MKRSILIIALTILSIVCYAPTQQRTFIVVKPTKVSFLSLDDIRMLLIKYDVQHVDIVLAQIRLETGNLHSKLYKTNNNLFGMKYPKGRETTALGERCGHAYYDSVESCVKDYALWQQIKYQGGDYYSFLEDIGYATDTQYVYKLQQMS